MTYPSSVILSERGESKDPFPDGSPPTRSAAPNLGGGSLRLRVSEPLRAG